MVPAALLVIDMLEDFFREGPLAEKRDALVGSINELVRDFRERGLPVIWVRQEFLPDLSDAFLEMRKNQRHVTIVGTRGAEILPELEREATDPVIVKKRYSAFFGTNLDETLARLAPGTLVFAGINSHACVRSAVVDAYQRDFPVIVADDCVASYDQEHHDVSRRYLAHAMAEFLSNAEIRRWLARPG